MFHLGGPQAGVHPPREIDDLLKLPRAVWLLGFVSLATDSASEAIYPLLPFFLTRVLGAGALSLGLVEGAAEGRSMPAMFITTSLIATDGVDEKKRPLETSGRCR